MDERVASVAGLALAVVVVLVVMNLPALVDVFEEIRGVTRPGASAPSGAGGEGSIPTAPGIGDQLTAMGEGPASGSGGGGGGSPPPTAGSRRDPSEGWMPVAARMEKGRVVGRHAGGGSRSGGSAGSGGSRQEPTSTPPPARDRPAAAGALPRGTGGSGHGGAGASPSGASHGPSPSGGGEGDPPGGDVGLETPGSVHVAPATGIGPGASVDSTEPGEAADGEDRIPSVGGPPPAALALLRCDGGGDARLWVGQVASRALSWPLDEALPAAMARDLSAGGTRPRALSFLSYGCDGSRVDEARRLLSELCTGALVGMSIYDMQRGRELPMCGL